MVDMGGVIRSFITINTIHMNFMIQYEDGYLSNILAEKQFYMLGHVWHDDIVAVWKIKEKPFYDRIEYNFISPEVLFRNC